MINFILYKCCVVIRFCIVVDWFKYNRTVCTVLIFLMSPGTKRLFDWLRFLCGIRSWSESASCDVRPFSTTQNIFCIYNQLYNIIYFKIIQYKNVPKIGWCQLLLEYHFAMIVKLKDSIHHTLHVFTGDWSIYTSPQYCNHGSSFCQYASPRRIYLRECCKVLADSQFLILSVGIDD